jgi:chromosome transmission fidelity protein 1
MMALPNGRKDFHHPFTPYDIQQQFMKQMYDCIEDGKVGIFESPTGTGKSLSLICASLTWLREHKRRTYDDAIAAIEVDEEEPDWMAEHARNEKRRELRQMRDELEERLRAAREREQKIKNRAAKGEPAAKKRKIVSSDEVEPTDEDQFVLDDYDSDTGGSKHGNEGSQYSAETTKLLEQLGLLPPKKKESSVEDVEEEVKVYFCSRTHSQLSQFVGELKRVKLPPGLPPEDGPKDVTEGVKQLSLGSRKNLCINPKVNKLESQTAVNERCIELQQSSTAAEQKCPFLPNKENEDMVLEFRDRALAEIRDIEDTAKIGAGLAICPYYASRTAIDPAELVTLPYPLLLQKAAREALGISLKGHVVVIDEAHNIIDAIEGIYSTQISSKQLAQAKESLFTYLKKFRNKLKGSNRIYVTQTVRVIDSLLAYTSGLDGKGEAGGVVPPNQLLAGKNVDQINLAKLVRYISDSKLARKVEGYAIHVARSSETEKNAIARARSESKKDVPTLTQVQNFLMTLMNPSKEGKVFWAVGGGDKILRYMLLDPSEHFREVVEQARAVILAGGTMSPMDDYRQQLFPYLPAIRTFSCGHLISASNLLVRVMGRDDHGPLTFSFKERTSASFQRIAGHLLKLVKLVQKGLVVFFPSYGFLEQAKEEWSSSSMLAKLEECKPVFWDNCGGSAEATFDMYKRAVLENYEKAGQPSVRPRGAVLLSVIGGKLSEGINFSDDLGRCVVVVGLPFPNLQTAEWKVSRKIASIWLYVLTYHSFWQARMEYIDKAAVARGQKKGVASKEHVENACMRSVNQAIGRVIRHQNDWASIILMDSRYNDKRLSVKLPGWIRTNLPQDAGVDAAGVCADVKKFFVAKDGT